MAGTNDLLPFQIGSTFGTTTSTVGVEWEGREFNIMDMDYTTNPAKPRAATNGTEIKRIRVVRNVSGISLLPGYLVSFKAGQYGKQVDGYTTTTAAEGYPVDEFLVSTGVANNDLFYITVGGPASVVTSLAADATDVFSAGSVLVALTAATSQATTAGRVSAQDLTGATANLGNQVMNRVGVAISASTTANTNVMKLAFINYRV